jgi:hypothetical protein
VKQIVFICLVWFGLVFNSEAQNLVPNGDFENHTNCTNIYIDNAISWCSASGGFTSAYYHPCFSDPLHSTPSQTYNACFHSFQVPHSGVAYIDIGSFVMSSTQERVYPQINLIDTLEAGKIYCVTYYVSVWNNAKYTIDKLGALLTPTPFPCFVAGGPTVAIVGNYTPQVVSTPSVALGDTLNWTEVSGSFTAVGNEAHLVIGDFFPNAQHYILNKYPTNCNGLAYYYVDDVSVEVVEIAKAKNDTLILQGDSAVIGANNSEAALFSWQPSTGLSCTNCPNPKASPTITTTYTVTKTQCKAVTSDVITVSVSPTGILEAEALEASVKILPNPTSGLITINSRFDIQKIELMNLTGQVLLWESINKKEYLLQLQDLAEGIYFVKVTYFSGLSFTKKVVKQ